MIILCTASFLGPLYVFSLIVFYLPHLRELNTSTFSAVIFLPAVELDCTASWCVINQEHATFTARRMIQDEDSLLSMSTHVRGVQAEDDYFKSTVLLLDFYFVRTNCEKLPGVAAQLSFTVRKCFMDFSSELTATFKVPGVAGCNLTNGL